MGAGGFGAHHIAVAGAVTRRRWRKATEQGAEAMLEAAGQPKPHVDAHQARTAPQTSSPNVGGNLSRSCAHAHQAGQKP